MADNVRPLNKMNYSVSSWTTFLLLLRFNSCFCRQTWVSYFPLGFFLHSLQNRTFGHSTELKFDTIP